MLLRDVAVSSLDHVYFLLFQNGSLYTLHVCVLRDAKLTFCVALFWLACFVFLKLDLATHYCFRFCDLYSDDDTATAYLF